MSISLLYRDDTAFAQAGVIGRDTPDQLALRKLTDRLGLAAYEADYFLGVLAKPLTREADILYRREILNCFQEYPTLAGRLSEQFESLRQLKSDYNDLKKERRLILRSASGEGIPDTAKNMLRSAGLTLKRCLLMVQAIEETIHAHHPKAAGLAALLKEMQRITDGGFGEMIALCTRFETFSETSGSAVLLELNALGTLPSCELADRQRIDFRKPEAKKKRFIFSKKEEVENPPAAPIDLHFCTLHASLRSNAILSLAELADDMTGQLFDRYLPIGRELIFYQCALKTIALLREKGAPVRYADIRADGALSFSGLYDPLLVQSCDKIGEIVPNDFAKSSAAGIAILGANGSGKTVWLRSVGLMQLFSQAGLPIPAKSAEIPLYQQIFTHFSSGEKEFEAGNEAGRFEQEVREMASILDEIGEHGLILLNETFQTTAYEEGAEGLSHILRYLAAGGNHWMLTSHLTELPRFFADGELALYRTDGSYRVRPDR